MQQIYFDNGSTSFPKAPNVAEEMFNTIKNGCFNVNRGGYSGAYDLENKIFETREKLCNLFNFNNPANVIFTNSITHSLNYVIKGLLKSGDHIIVSSMEHNAMIRPLVQASQNGVEF
ncbi:MAG: aminotransferase class V-fold PLP-dependent enzyme, partial [Oscillospiraceae bacterium]